MTNRMTLPAQAGILQPVPALARYLLFSLGARDALRAALDRLAQSADGERVVVGIGPQLVAALGAEVPGLCEFAALAGPGVQVPSTPTALLCWLRGGDTDDMGDLVHLARALEHALAPALRLERVVDAFCHARGASGLGRDLTGYEDGTENPTGDAAVAATFVQGEGPGRDGASFLALQQWRHDFAAFDAMAPAAQDAMIGRRRSDNEELIDAPASAHVKRTAQEDFDPEAFLSRRSMPWTDGQGAGLMFAAFGASLDAFDAQMRRMAGLDDGIVDALFSISKPISGANFWCPPMDGARLDLRALLQRA